MILSINYIPDIYRSGDIKPMLIPFHSIQFVTVEDGTTCFMLTNGEVIYSSTSIDQIKKQVKEWK